MARVSAGLGSVVDVVVGGMVVVVVVATVDDVAVEVAASSTL
jgi:hypothetical protein